ncbi:MAG TPA: diphosphate--fructose-6-phosphate 1-phosphotransferase, partial [Elusimicrobiota bacterium]|nr:diphosphate--fructose-6-phosphate 1-phosphotransferase [Elusimicrobiota bacterium]
MTVLKVSELQKERAEFEPVLPALLRLGPASVSVRLGKATHSVADQETVRSLFPKTYGLPVVSFVKGKNPALRQKSVKVGVVLSGGQAPGGHNVLAGLLDGLKKANPKNKLIGFLGGPSGILNNQW